LRGCQSQCLKIADEKEPQESAKGLLSSRVALAHVRVFMTRTVGSSRDPASVDLTHRPSSVTRPETRSQNVSTAIMRVDWTSYPESSTTGLP
jgi:hypothetical protein